MLITRDLKTTMLRMPQCLLGVAVAGFAFALLDRSELGLGPWEVLADGVHEQTGVALGTAALLVGLISMLLWIPLGQRVGIGTVIAVAVFGVSMNLVLPWVPEVDGLVMRAAYLVGSVMLWGFGIALYLGAGLGPGPRDGIMTALVRRGYSVRRVRAIKELTVLMIGIALGGTAGIGTLVFACSIGLFVQWSMRLLQSLPPIVATDFGAS